MAIRVRTISEQGKADTDTTLYKFDEGMKENIFIVNILCCLIKQIRIFCNLLTPAVILRTTYLNNSYSRGHRKFIRFISAL